MNLKEEVPKIIASSISPMEDAYKQITKIDVDIAGIKENLLSSLKDRFRQFSGNTPVYLHHIDSTTRARYQILVSDDLYVQPSIDLIQEMENLLGQERFSLTF